MKPTLFVLAAGMGCRCGGLKELDGLGPNNETIMDYSVYDAIRAGFGKIIFVIKRDFEKEFIEKVISKYINRIEIDIVFQSLDAIPEGYAIPKGKRNLWGTNHAVMMAAKAIDTPFAVINADDFYGADAFRVMGENLQALFGETNKYCMVGYLLKNTMSDFGSVSRGVCSADAEGNLVDIEELTHIVKVEGGAEYKDGDGNMHPVSVDTIVSMNMFGFTPDYFNYSEALFKEFLVERAGELKSEYFIPLVVNKLIENKTISMKVLSSTAEWFGVTYKEDRPIVVSKLEELAEKGIYPHKLW